MKRMGVLHQLRALTLWFEYNQEEMRKNHPLEYRRFAYRVRKVRVFADTLDRIHQPKSKTGRKK